MTKRIVSGIFILTALGALGVILAGALTSGEQLIVRFLTAVIVAALGLYVISDLRLQADDDAMAAKPGPQTRIPKVAAPPNSTAAFMATVTRRGDKRGQAAKTTAESGAPVRVQAGESDQQNDQRMVTVGATASSATDRASAAVEGAGSNDRTARPPTVAAVPSPAPETIVAGGGLAPIELPATELVAAGAGGPAINSQPSAGGHKTIEFGGIGTNGTPAGGPLADDAPANGQSGDHNPSTTSAPGPSTPAESGSGPASGHPAPVAGPGPAGVSSKPGAPTPIAPGGTNGVARAPETIAVASIAGGDDDQPPADDAGDTGADDGPAQPTPPQAAPPQVVAAADLSRAFSQVPETMIGLGRAKAPRGGAPDQTTEGNAAATADTDVESGASQTEQVAEFQYSDDLQAADHEWPKKPSSDVQAEATNPFERASSPTEAADGQTDGAVQNRNGRSVLEGAGPNGSSHGSALHLQSAATADDAPTYPQAVVGGPTAVPPPSDALPPRPVPSETGPSETGPSDAGQPDVGYQAETTLPIPAPPNRLEAADYVDAPLAPIIDLRDINGPQTDDIDTAINAGEVEVIATLIEQGMLSTAGPISDRDVRTMVYVAFTSNELRKLLLAGGSPDGPNYDLDLGPVELFDERIHAPAPKTLYPGKTDDAAPINAGPIKAAPINGTPMPELPAPEAAQTSLG